MPGYVIHIAVAKEYLRKHSNNENEEEFIKGTIYPDGVKDKSLTHYGAKSSKVILKDFLKENSLDTSFNRGYFLHLVTDYLFYNKYLDKFSTDIYNDYDITNRRLIEKYDIKLPKEIKNRVFFKEGETHVLDIDLACKVIDEVSELDLKQVKEEVLEDNKKWTFYKKLS